MPAGFESNIYYELAPPFRGHGYATEVLALLLHQAANQGLHHIIATVNENNLASIKVIEKNGGKLLEKGKTDKGVCVLKYSLKAH